MGFSRKDFQSRSSCPPPGHLPDPGIKFWSPALQAETLHWATGKAQTYRLSKQLCPRLALSQRQGPERVKVRILGPWEGCWGWKFYSQWKQITPGMDRTFPGVVVDFDSWGWMEPICFPCLLTEKKWDFLDFLGGPVVKNPPANAGNTGLVLGPGRSHMPTRANKPLCPNYWALAHNKRSHCNGRVAPAHCI